jgi:hypothetical protein
MCTGLQEKTDGGKGGYIGHYTVLEGGGCE